MRTRSTLDGWNSTSPAPNLFVKGLIATVLEKCDGEAPMQESETGNKSGPMAVLH